MNWAATVSDSGGIFGTLALVRSPRIAHRPSESIKGIMLHPVARRFRRRTGCVANRRDRAGRKKVWREFHSVIWPNTTQSLSLLCAHGRTQGMMRWPLCRVSNHSSSRSLIFNHIWRLQMRYDAGAFSSLDHYDDDDMGTDANEGIGHGCHRLIHFFLLHSGYGEQRMNERKKKQQQHWTTLRE